MGRAVPGGAWARGDRREPELVPMYATLQGEDDCRDARALAEACLLGAYRVPTGSPMPSAMSGRASPSATPWCGPDAVHLAEPRAPAPAQLAGPLGQRPSLQNEGGNGRLGAGRTGSDFGGATDVVGDLTPALAKNVSADLNFSVASRYASRA